MTTHAHHPTARDVSWSERYVHAVTRRLPDGQRADVAEELRGSLADRVEALGHERPDLDPVQAEYAAVAELGDPERLAASYADRSLVLIGPELYPTWSKVLRLVLVTAVPAATVLFAVIDALGGESFGAIVGGAAWTAFTVALHCTFWVTLTFALVERSGDAARDDLAPDWTPDALPDLPRDDHGSLADAVTSVVWLGLVGGALVWQHLRSPIEAGGERIPVLDPALWSGWLPLVLVMLVVEAGFEVVRYRTGRWTTPLVVANVVIGSVFAGVFTWLAATDRLLNPAAVAAIRDDWSGFDPGVVNTLVVVGVLVVWLWDGIDGWWKSRR